MLARFRLDKVNAFLKFIIGVKKAPSRDTSSKVLIFFDTIRWDFHGNYDEIFFLLFECPVFFQLTEV